MAERRMFAKTIIDSDAFLEMPQSSQLLYFHLSMRADDDGFVNKPKSIMRIAGCKDDDMMILFAKKFVIPFSSGVCVIKHWRINNYIQKDRYTETKYKDEMRMLELDENKAYRLPDPGENQPCIQDVHTMDTQVSLGQSRSGKTEDHNIHAITAREEARAADHWENSVPHRTHIIRDVWGRMIGMPIEAKTMRELLAIAADTREDLFKAALIRAATYGASNVAAYMRATLADWDKKGYRTYRDVK